MKNDRTDELREASGKIVYSDPLTSFLYQLMRDELPAGTVEKLVREVVNEGAQDVLFTNGWLAQYANNLAEMLKNAHTEKLKESLAKVFDDEEKEREKAALVSKAMEKLRSPDGEIEDFTNEELAELESKVVTACKKVEEADTDKGSEPVVAWTSFEEAAEMIEHLKAEGQISKEDADRLSDELKEVEDEISSDTKVEQEIPDEAIEEIKPSCCGKCKEVTDTTIVPPMTAEHIVVDVSVVDDKWQKTQEFLQEIDKELNELASDTKKE